MKIYFERFKNWKSLSFDDDHFDEDTYISHVCDQSKLFTCLEDVIKEHFDEKKSTILMSRIVYGFNQYWMKCTGYDYFSSKYETRKITDLSESQLEEFLYRIQNELSGINFFPVITTCPTTKEDDETKYY